MSSAGSGGLPAGWCDLPAVPGVPDAASQAVRAILNGPDSEEICSSLHSRFRQQGLQEGDEAEIEAEKIDTLLADDEVVDALLKFSMERSPFARRWMAIRSILGVCLLASVLHGACFSGVWQEHKLEACPRLRAAGLWVMPEHVHTRSLRFQLR